VEIAGPFTLLGQADPASSEVVNLVARTTKKRQSALRKIQTYGLPFVPLIDPGVDMMGVDVGRDITVYRGVLFCANATVSEGSVIFAGAIVGHGCYLGRCCIVAPGAVINARVELGDGVYIGTNASILPELKIGAWATIGANSAVVQDVPVGATVMGVPAQLLIMGSEDLSGETSNDLDREGGGLEQTEIQSDALRKLRVAQEKYIRTNRSVKT
jgi:acetyltransferase-like isoleucine patch superfamily enzyme